MALAAHHVHGDSGPGLPLRGVKHAQLEALGQHAYERHVNVHMAHQAFLQAVLQV